MTAAFRILAFAISALGLEIVRGPGAAVLILAALIGLARATPLLLVAAIAGGAIVSLAMPEASIATGKVSHSLSNAPFVGLLYVAPALLGYFFGRAVRAIRRL